MKYLKSALLLLSVIAMTSVVKAQTADEVIAKYVDAIGGKATLSKITSVYTENSIEVMGNESPSTTILLNGKGVKTISDMGGQKMVQCYTDKGGWMINPMAGSSEPAELSAEDYNTAKSQIYVDVLSDYSAKGYKVELAGSENVGNINATKLKVVSPENVTSFYYIDPATNYAIKISMSANMMGQPMDVSVLMSDYQKTDLGLVIPHKMEVNYGGQFAVIIKTKKIEFNKPVDTAIFEKGNLNM